MSDRNKASARRFFEDVISRGDLEAIEQVMTADYRDHDPGTAEDIVGYENGRRDAITYRTAFPDIEATVEDQVAEGDRVATRITVRGTHRGELRGIPPTGAAIEVTGTVIHRFVDGKMAEGWWNWDVLGLLVQIGALPEEARTGEPAAVT